VVSESIWLAVIQWTLSPLLLLIVGAVLNRKIRETKQEITNSHPMHLRDDLDGKFQLVLARQDTILTEVKNIDDKLGSQRDDIDTLFHVTADHEKRLTGQAGKLRRVSTGK
jgi:hypothetical protein